MSIQKKVLTLYFSFATLLILAHYGANAQSVIPDAKLKTHVSSLSNSLETILQLQPKRFEYNHYAYNFLNLPKGKHFGFIAEDFKKVLPHLVSHETKSYRTGKNAQETAVISAVDLEKLVPVLVGAIQEQQVMIEQLQQEISGLKKQLQQP